MKIAQQLKEKNIAEYLIYMWQIEDLIRANDCDVDRIEENIVFRYQVSVVELRNKNGQKEEPELETCFEALYGMMLLRLQKKPVSPETTKAMEAISSFLSMLANYYDKDRKGELKLE